MGDLGTMTTAPPPPVEGRVDGDGGRAVRRARSLPGGRAVLGALLVAAAAVGVFAAYLDATAAPDTRYLVATADVAPGTRFASIPDVAQRFEWRALELDPDLAARAFVEGREDDLLGRAVLSPVAEGELLLRSAVVDDGGVAAASKVSFAVDPAAALGGTLRVGERVDILATYGNGTDAYTAYVALGVPITAAVSDGGAGIGGGSSGALTLTVAVSSPEDVQALAHAVAVADVVVTRSTVLEGGREVAPPPYRPSPDAAGPRADPAGDPVGRTSDQPSPVPEDDPEGAGPPAGPADAGPPPGTGAD